MYFKKTDIFSHDAVMLIEELNQVLESIVGNNGTKHVNLSDFSKTKAVFMWGTRTKCQCVVQEFVGLTSILGK